MSTWTRSMPRLVNWSISRREQRRRPPTAAARRRCRRRRPRSHQHGARARATGGGARRAPRGAAVVSVTALSRRVRVPRAATRSSRARPTRRRSCWGRSGGQSRARRRRARAGAPRRSTRSSSARESAATSSGGTSTPSRPSSMISPGPRGQSKETTARPLLIASTTTIPKPSKREESTNTEPCGERVAEVARRAEQQDVVRQPGVEDLALAAPRAAARGRRCAAASPGGPRRRAPGLDQQVEALLRVEPARGDRDLALRPRLLAAERGHRVGELHDAGGAAERRLVVARSSSVSTASASSER